MSDEALIDGICTYLRSVKRVNERFERLCEMNKFSAKVIEAVKKKMDIKPVTKQIDVPSATDSHV